MRSPTCSPTSPSAAHDAPQSDAKAREQLERRRQRNRESMRRVRQRKRGAKEDAQRSVAQLERQLQALVAASKRQAQRLQGDDGAMAELLAQTAALSVANQRLRAQVHKFQEAEAAVQRMLTDESARPPPVEQLDERDDNQDAHAGFDDISLAPLLEWLMVDGQMGKLVDLATLKIFENAEITRSLVPRGNMALGWEDRRCIDASATARYHLSKRFLHNSRTRPLFDKTWHATTDMKRLASVMRWAHGMKVLQWLNPDAAVVARELEIPNSRPEQGFSSTRFRFTLIVFRRALPNGQGFLIGTCNLNVYGSSVDECLAKDVSFHMGVNAHTMYGWVFTPIVDPSTKQEAGADVTLVGLTTNGQRAYAHNVLMEMVTVVLLWENAFVGPILRIKPS